MPFRLPSAFCAFVLCSALALLAGCHREDAAARLEARFSELETALEARSPERVLATLHEKFTARQTSQTPDGIPESGRDWAKRTMTLAFLRYKNVRLVTRNVDTRIDPRFPDHATTHCEVLLTGAAGRIPDNARNYRVELEWVKEKQDWKLLRLDWQ